MLNESGEMVYITPSSWCTSLAGGELRKYLIENRILSVVVNCGHEKVFPDSITYSMITVMDKKNHEYMNTVTLYRLDGKEEVYVCTRALEHFITKGLFLFNNGDLSVVKKVLSEKRETDHVLVKNGFATLNDKLFVVEDESVAKSCGAIPCVKSSKGHMTNIVFPYDELGKPKQLDELPKNTADYLRNRATELNMDITRENWHLYGRTQALTDVCRDKYAISPLMDSKGNIKIRHAPAGCGVYSGLYAVSYSLSEQQMLMVMTVLQYDDEFVEYVRALGRYKNGGYYTVTSKELQAYINYLVDRLFEKKAFIEYGDK